MKLQISSNRKFNLLTKYYQNNKRFNRFLKIITSEIFIIGLLAFLCVREMMAVVTRKFTFADFSIDDSIYLTTSIDKAGTPPFYGIEGAPIYIAWLKLLGNTFGYINALPVNQALLLVLAPMLLYTILRIRKQSVFLSTTLTLLFLSSDVFRSSWSAVILSTPLVGCFAIVVGLLWVVIFRKFLFTKHVYLIFLTGSFFLIYIRPEYILSFWVLAVIVAIGIIRAIARNLINRSSMFPREILLASISLLAMVIMGLWIGFPGGNGRLDFAFNQHFAFNSLAFIPGRIQTIHPFLSWDITCAESFGADKCNLGRSITLREALEANSNAVAAHIGMNVARFPVELGRIFLDRQHPFSLLFLLVMLGIIGISAIARLIQILRFTRFRQDNILLSLQRFIDYPWLIAMLVWMLPPLVSMIIIYPRLHYMAMALVWFTVGIVGSTSWRKSDDSIIERFGLVLCAVLAIAIYPDPAMRISDLSRQIQQGFEQSARQFSIQMEHLQIPPHKIGTFHMELSLLLGYRWVDISQPAPNFAKNFQGFCYFVTSEDFKDIIVRRLIFSNQSFDVLNTGYYQLIVNLNNLESCKSDQVFNSQPVGSGFDPPR